jgi:hypothetical protein
LAVFIYSPDRVNSVLCNIVWPIVKFKIRSIHKQFGVPLKEDPVRFLGKMHITLAHATKYDLLKKVGMENIVLVQIIPTPRLQSACINYLAFRDIEISSKKRLLCWWLQ